MDAARLRIRRSGLHNARAPRVGLVLAAGGIAGSAWLTGALIALQAQTGWDPAEADIILGTSAGSLIGSMSAAGIEPRRMAELVIGESAEHTVEQPARLAAACTGTEFTLACALPPIGPGSWRLALSSLLHPGSHTPAALVSGLLPRGMLSTDPIVQVVERVIHRDWPRHDAFWAVACDYGNGERAVFGRAGSPEPPIGRAVAASCAVPGFYHPVTIGTRRYVDGGMCSASNLDLLNDADLDLVICLSPMSSNVPARGLAGGLAANVRKLVRRQLHGQVQALRARGTEVAVVEPTSRDLELMGTNPMARSPTLEIVRRAQEEAAISLRAMATRGEALPTASHPATPLATSALRGA